MSLHQYLKQIKVKLKKPEAASKEALAIWMKAFKPMLDEQLLPEEFLLGNLRL